MNCGGDMTRPEYLDTYILASASWDKVGRTLVDDQVARYKKATSDHGEERASKSHIAARNRRL